LTEDVKGSGDIEGEKPLGVSRSGSGGLRGFESHPPHFEFYPPAAKFGFC
jgi:hypothetical protein